MPRTGGWVSEFAEDYKSFWGVPIESKVIRGPTNQSRPLISYKVKILESYGHIETQTIDVLGAIDLGGGGDLNLALGVPQFLSVYSRNDGRYSAGPCTPEFPYTAIKGFLQSNLDTYVPDISQCYAYYKYGRNQHSYEVNLEDSDCSIWEAHSAGGYGQRDKEEDRLKYIASWKENETTDLILHLEGTSPPE